jgi:Tol biopolymer transport system component
MDGIRPQSRPQWSPDGGWILCETTDGLALIASDGRTSRVVSENEWLAYAWYHTLLLSTLAFSPDGRRLAYQRIGRDEAGRIWISTLAGGPPIRLSGTSSSAYEDAPTWSPDGDWVAFVASPTPDEWLLVKARVGRGDVAPMILTKEVRPQTRPQWSPDGRWILVQTLSGLVLVDSNGEASELLSEDEWLSYAWTVDGGRVFGLRVDNRNHIVLVELNIKTRRERVVNEC